jgi:hypothetical protein
MSDQPSRMPSRVWLFPSTVILQLLPPCTVIFCLPFAPNTSKSRTQTSTSTHPHLLPHHILFSPLPLLAPSSTSVVNNGFNVETPLVGTHSSTPLFALYSLSLDDTSPSPHPPSSSPSPHPLNTPPTRRSSTPPLAPPSPTFTRQRRLRPAHHFWAPSHSRPLFALSTARTRPFLTRAHSHILPSSFLALLPSIPLCPRHHPSPVTPSIWSRPTSPPSPSTLLEALTAAAVEGASTSCQRTSNARSSTSMWRLTHAAACQRPNGRSSTYPRP